MSYRFLPICLLFAIASPLGALAQQGDAAAGATVLKKCAICHVAETDQNKVGPSLNGLFGRPAGIHRISPIRRRCCGLARPASYGMRRRCATICTTLKAKVKGTKMTFVGVKDDTEITNLIAYLKQYSKQ